MVPRHLPRPAIEAGSTGLWSKYLGDSGAVIGLDRFGESAPAPQLFEHFGITAAAVAARALALVDEHALCHAASAEPGSRHC